MFPVPCQEDEFRCHAGFVCADKLQVCDDHHQCIDGSDDFKTGRMFRENGGHWRFTIIIKNPASVLIVAIYYSRRN